MLPHVIIIGGGFGGLNAARSLASKVRVTLIDKNNYHLFQPFLYQVATCELSYSDIAVPLRTQFEAHNDVSILMDEVIKIEAQERMVKTLNGVTLSYDYLIIATGSKNNFFGNDALEENTIGLKSLSDALKIRNRWLELFEKAEYPTSKIHPKQINCLIIGGGATGVETIGSMLEFIQYSLKSNFTNFKKSNIKVILVEAGPRLLPSFSKSISNFTEKALSKLGAIIKLNTKVIDIQQANVALSNGETINADIVIWAAGVKASNIKDIVIGDIKVGDLGKIKVKEDLSIEAYPEVFVIGDASEVLDNNGVSLPGLAAVATQQGKFVAKVIINKVKGKKIKLRFKYNNLGNLAIIGRYLGIVEFNKVKLKGVIGWVIWNLVHIYFLIGFRNRLIVFIKWLWIYFTRSKSERIIIKPND